MHLFLVNICFLFYCKHCERQLFRFLVHILQHGTSIGFRYRNHCVICLAASLSCEACDSSSPKFEAISGSQSFVGATVLVRDTFIPCVHPADMALDFEARGAEAVVISNDGEFFR